MVIYQGPAHSLTVGKAQAPYSDLANVPHGPRGDTQALGEDKDT